METESSIVEEVRQRAMEISRQYDHDTRKYGEHLMEAQKKHQDRLVDQITVVQSRPEGEQARR